MEICIVPVIVIDLGINVVVIYILKMKVQIVNKSKHNLPYYATEFSAGVDLKADTDEPVTIMPHQNYVFPTGLYMAIPEGYVGKIYARSGLACKHGLVPSNATGVVDADYRGHVKVSLTNTYDTPYTVEPGERIAQFILEKFEKIEWDEVKELPTTERGEGGFGSTGK